MSQLDAVLARIDADFDHALARLFEVMRIKSISTDPAYRADCKANADWHVADLAGIGFAATAHATPGHPIVLAHDHAAGGMRALFYGHYDVQPVDPLELWTRDPFDPVVEADARGVQVIRGRGSADDKAQLMTFVEACRAWKHVAGGLPISVSVLLEGEEESGGVNLPPFLASHADELRADIGLICDTNMWDARTPAIVTMLRGLCAEEVIIHGADRDLHSGFYDGVPELPESLASQWAGLDFDASKFLGAVGLSVPAGERGRSALEQTWSRPTCEINGMGGGYTGDGFKTVIPAMASAKISFRLVFEQDPHAVRKAFRAHVEARLPKDCRAEFIEHGSGRAIRFPNEADAFARTQAALSDEWGRGAVFVGGGGSIPVTAALKTQLGMDVVLAGFGLEDDRIHSPNEKYDLDCFRRGIRSWARVLAALAK